MGVPLLLTWLRRRFASCFKPAVRQDNISYSKRYHTFTSHNDKEQKSADGHNVDSSHTLVECDNLYIDLNALLYQAATLVGQREFVYSARSDVEDAVLYKLVEILDDIIVHLVQPIGLVYIAVDGIAPLGKLAQQRARRKKYNRHVVNKRRGGYASPPEQRQECSDFAHHDNNFAQSKGGTFAELWDGNCISVGTVFMSKVMTVLHTYAVSKVEHINQQRLQAHIAAMKEAQQMRFERQEEHKQSQMKNTSTNTTLSSEDKLLDACEHAFRSLAIVIDDVIRPGEGENKIIDCIRQQRMKEMYNPHTCHVICSSDTDVTMSALLLHEPNVYILRYEPPPSLGGKESKYMFIRGNTNTSYKSNNNNVSNKQMIDNWLSTYFSIEEFRNKLRVVIGFDDYEIHNNNNVKDEREEKIEEEEEKEELKEVTDNLINTTTQRKENHHDEHEESEHFERALHDVVFVLLLFGNDFLPSLSGTIQEGTLDTLLSVLATEFVSRHKYIVTAETNLIDFDSARYLLECLRDIKTGSGFGSGTEGLQVYTDFGTGETNSNTIISENNKDNKKDAMNNNNVDTDKVLDWGFENDSAFQAKQTIAKAEMASKCYSYWTMLQWALMYNTTGQVEHWNCYYPYSTAPSLEHLREHCGILTYDALIELSQRQVNTNTIVNSVNCDDNNEKNIVHNTNMFISPLTCNRPTDVLTQLLVLLPAHSIYLLPSVIQQSYEEIASSVQAPMESLNLAAISKWCRTKEDALSGIDRLRLTAYRYFAQDTNILSLHNLEKKQTNSGYEMHLNELVFAAYWPLDLLSHEFSDLRHKFKRELQSKANDNNANNSKNNAKNILSNFFASSSSSSSSSKSSLLTKFSAEMLFATKPVNTSITKKLSEEIETKDHAVYTKAKIITTVTSEGTSQDRTINDQNKDKVITQEDQIKEIQNNVQCQDNSDLTIMEDDHHVSFVSDVNNSYHFIATPVSTLHNSELAATFGELRGNRFYFPPSHSNAVVENITSRTILSWSQHDKSITTTTSVNNKIDNLISNNTNKCSTRTVPRLHWALAAACEYSTTCQHDNDCKTININSGSSNSNKVQTNYIINVHPHAFYFVRQRSSKFHNNGDDGFKATASVQENKRQNKRMRESNSEERYDVHSKSSDDDATTKCNDATDHGNKNSNVIDDNYNTKCVNDETDDKKAMMQARMEALKAKIALCKKKV